MVQLPTERLVWHRAPQQRRAVALILAMTAVIVSTIIAYTYLAAQETSIGIARNIRDHAQARYIAESGLDLTLNMIRSTSDWRTSRPNGAWITNTAFLGGTVSIRGEDGQDSNGDGLISVPTEGDGDLANGSNDVLTLTVTGKSSGSTHALHAVVTPVGGTTMVVYGKQGESHVYYRTRSGSGWSSENPANDMGNNPKWFMARYCPARNEVSVCSLNNANDIYLQFWNGSDWTSSSMLLTGTAGISSERPVDIAYEQNSGDLLVAYRASAGGTLRYRTASSTNVSAESAYALPTTGNLKWVRLVPKPGFDEIIAITMDNNNDLAALVWNGNSWGNAILLEANGQTAGNEQFAAAYEGLTKRALVAWSHSNSNTFYYCTWNGSTWSSTRTGPAFANNPYWVKLAADPASNKMIVGCLLASKDVAVSSWDGSAWADPPLVVETDTKDNNRRNFDVAYERLSRRGLVVWGRGGINNFYYRTWNGSTWSAEAAGPGLTDKVSFAQLINDGSQNLIYLTILQKGSGELESFVWNGGSFGPRIELVSNASGPNTTESYMVASCPASVPGGSSGSYSVDLR